MRLTLSALGVLLSLLLIAALDIGVAGKLPGAAGEAAAQAQCTRFAVIGDYGDAGSQRRTLPPRQSWNRSSSSPPATTTIPAAREKLT